MNGWIFSGLVLVGAAVSGSAQETKRPPAPPLPTPPTLSPAPRPPVISPFSAPRATPTPVAAAAPVQVVPPQPFPPAAFPGSPGAIANPASGLLTALKFDAERKDYTSKAGEAQAPFTFHLTNTSPSEVSITSVRTSCGCTVAKLPSTPWVIAPGQGGPIEVSVNLAGKSGTITKSVTVESSAGTKSLLVTVNIGGTPGALPSAAPHPVMGDAERLKNMQLALADRQVMFKNQDCTKCHSEPAKGLADGRQLYSAVCAVCHESPIRAAMVPDLRTLKHPTDADYWRNWITFGRAGSMMPAFAQSEGGPLSDTQVDALVNYVLHAFPGQLQGSRLPRVLQPRQSASIVSPAVAVPPLTTPAPGVK